MHLPTSGGAVTNTIPLGTNQNNINNNTNSINNNNNNSDWGWSNYKGGMLEPPNSGSSSPPRSQELWWTERLVLEAQQEYPGELGKRFLFFFFL